MERAFIILVAASTVFVAWFVAYRPAPIEAGPPQVFDDAQLQVDDAPQLVFPNTVPTMPRVATKTVPKDRSKTALTSSKTLTVPKDRPLKAAPTAAPPAPLHWTLPFSCANAKWYSAHFTTAQLEAMRKAAGMAAPTADQRAQIQACLAGRIK